jgi:hypothetical protein
MLNPDYNDILSAFNAEGVEYLVVGAYALAAHGLPRATGDIDVWVRPSPDNGARVWRALARFGAPMDELRPDDFAIPGTIFQIGVVPRRIDVITSIDGVEFDEAWPRRLVVNLAGVDLPVIGRADLIVNKRASGRPQDLVDLDRLTRSGAQEG